MAEGSKRDRKRANRQARLEAEAAAARRARTRRRAVIVGIGAALVVAIVLVTALTGGDDDGTDVATSASTTTSAAEGRGSAAGEPCVPVAGDLPAGAPAVPVKEGPPPKELVTEDLKVGEGAVVPQGATITANYIGVSCSTGKVFDSSYQRNQPATFPLANVIKGWQDGIPGMKVGGQRLLGIPPDQAYGAAGRPPDIAPDETLWFVVEVVEVKA